MSITAILHCGVLTDKMETIMEFDYIQYYRGCFILPIILLSCFIIYLIVLIIGTLIVIRKHNIMMLTKERIISVVLSVILVLSFCSMNMGHLYNGGIHLYGENEDTAIETLGTIENIEYMNCFEFPSKLESEFKTDEINGVRITIDGVQYRAIAKGSLEIGDDVMLVFLPYSRYILAIYKTDI